MGGPLGDRPLWRNLTAFAGGVVLIIGARLAVHSGHGLSGLSQLAVSGFVALAAFPAAVWASSNCTAKEGNDDRFVLKLV